MSHKREISEEDFLDIAETASKTGCLKSRKETHGETFAIFLNSNMVMSSEVLKNGERKYFSFIDAWGFCNVL